MKKLVSILLVLVLASVLVLTACGEKPEPAPSGTTLSAKEVWNKVMEVSGFGEMTLVPTRDYADIYGIDSSKIEDSVWYMSENSATNADEVAIMKVNDPAYADALKKILEDRVETQVNVCRTYAPEQAAKLEKTEVVSAGSWVYYCVGDNYDAMMNVLNTVMK